jgi:DNA polymerase III delta subunit
VIYFIHGPDRLLARQAALAIVSELDPDGANTSWLDGRESSLAAVAAAVGTVSFFGAPRVVVVTDLLTRPGGDASGSDSAPTGADRRGRGHPELAALLAAVPDDHGLVLLEPTLSSPPASLSAAAPGATVIGSAPPRGGALLIWIGDAAERAGSQVDRRAAQLLAETLYPQTWERAANNPRFDRPPDLALILGEIEKLATAAHPGSISAELIRELVPGGADQRVFRFLDAAASGELRQALGELERLHDAGDEPAMTLAQLLGQIELGAVANAGRGKDPGSVARELGSISAGRMSAVMSSASRRGARGAESLFAAVRVDRRFKTGRLRTPADALHDLVLAMAARAAVDHENDGP